MKIGLSWLLLASFLETGAMVWHFGRSAHFTSDDPAQPRPIPFRVGSPRPLLHPDAFATPQTQEVGALGASPQYRFSNVSLAAQGAPVESSEPPSSDSSVVPPNHSEEREETSEVATEHRVVTSIHFLPHQERAAQSTTPPISDSMPPPDSSSPPPLTQEEEDRVAAMEQRLVTTIERDAVAAPAPQVVAPRVLAPRVLTTPSAEETTPAAEDGHGFLSFGQLAGGTVDRVFAEGTLPWIAMSDGRRLFEGANLRFGYRIQQIREKSVLLDGPNGSIVVPCHPDTSE